MVPLINKPTRISRKSATAIDNIFTNCIFTSLETGIIKTVYRQNPPSQKPPRQNPQTKPPNNNYIRTKPPKPKRCTDKTPQVKTPQDKTPQ